MPRYLSVLELKDYARSEIPTADDAFIEAACDSAENFMDQACARRFVVATSATARVFMPLSGGLLRIHDCTTVTLVVNDGTTLTAADYQLEPLNGLTWAGESRPYDQIRLTSGTTWDRDSYGEATISVTATWGWVAIPARVKQAALIVAKEIIANRDEVKFGLVGFSDVGGVSPRSNPIVTETINHYRRVEAIGIA